MRPPTPRFFAKLPKIERRDRSEDVVSRGNVPGEPRESRRDEQEVDLRVQAGELTYFNFEEEEVQPNFFVASHIAVIQDAARTTSGCGLTSA